MLYMIRVHSLADYKKDRFSGHTTDQVRLGWNKLSGRIETRTPIYPCPCCTNNAVTAMKLPINFRL